ncbi:MAG: 16S rRNA (cytosine(967)-C(5))-methyltransferase RsmB [Clostridia bacterium]|nr:16S rRNA (cytosine(967)-C(5))-methyltransferase RsmB [Clostridia bacterium]
MSDNRQTSGKPKNNGNFGRGAGNTAKAGNRGNTAGGHFGGNGERKPSFSRNGGNAGKPQSYGQSGNTAGRRMPYGRPAAVRPVMSRRGADAPVEGIETRRMALSVIRAVTENGAYASLTLSTKLTNCGLSVVDRRLVSRLVYDTLDNLIYLDHCLSQVMAKPDTDIKLRNILRLGACQILLEDRIPESAATNTCVALCAELGMEGLKGVCNGILRNLVRRKDENALTMPDPESEPLRAASVKYSVPEWLAEQLINDYGENAEKLMAGKDREDHITIRPNLVNETDMESLLAGKVWEHGNGMIPGSWRIRGMADIARDADFLAGRYSIQSESSMMACLALAPKRGMKVLDCCAAPGGKSCFIAELMGGTGRVQAWDVHEHRTALTEAQVKRLGLENVRPMTRDALIHREDMDGTMDAVLLDAPCSGLGVIAEKPDIKLHVTRESVNKLAALQSQLLDVVCNYVSVGGTLVYSTCSVLKDENEHQIDAFLKRHPEFRIVPLPDTIPEKYRRYAATGLQLLPYRDGVEGFYICRMERKA